MDFGAFIVLGIFAVFALGSVLYTGCIQNAADRRAQAKRAAGAVAVAFIWGAWVYKSYILDEGVVVAAMNGDCHAVERLLDRGGSANASWEDGTPAIIWAIHRPEIVRVLLAHGANPQAHDHQGNTALLVARKGREWQVARLLRHAGTVR